MINPRSIRIVLVGTTHAGNIGAVARAMKTMGLQSLCLVSPQADPASEEACRRSAGADDILQDALLVDDLLQALADCRLVIGTSARKRTIEWPNLAPADAAMELVTTAAEGPVAVVFGPERTGLSNVDLERCHALVTIPANPDFSSLNIAAAVQIIAYEIRVRLVSFAENSAGEPEDLADPVKLEGLRRHLAQTLGELDFIKSNPPTKLLRKFVRLMNRARMSPDEVDMLRGVLTAVQSAARGLHKR